MATPRIFVLSTQKLSAGLINEAAASGVRLDVAPFIRTELLEPGELPTGAVTVVFTSQHAVEALPAMGPEWKVFCTEGNTRRLVEQRFGAGVIAGTAPSAEELAQEMIERKPPERAVFFCGDLRRQELPALLRQAGWVVEERVVYRTLLTPQRVEREYAGIIFFSPSAVESYFSINPANDATVYFAIGRTTAAAVRVRTGRDAIVSSKPDKTLLVNAMITYFKV